MTNYDKTLNVTKVYYILTENGRAAATFNFFYNLIDKQGAIEEKSVLVTISDVVCINWGYPFWSYNPYVDYPPLIKILVEIVKEYVFQKLSEDTLQDNEKLNIFSHTYSGSRPYNPEELEDPESAGYKIYC